MLSTYTDPVYRDVHTSYSVLIEGWGIEPRYEFDYDRTMCLGVVSTTGCATTSRPFVQMEKAYEVYASSHFPVPEWVAGWLSAAQQKHKVRR